MKTLKTWIAVLAMTLLCGCFQVEDDLTLQADGSGKVKLKLHSNLPEEAMGMLGMSGRYGGGGPSMYPPTSEAEARQYFPPKDFTLKFDQKTADDGRTVLIEAAFKNVNALLASPYGRVHQLTLSTNANGTLKLQALSGGSALAQAAQFKPEGEMAAFEIPGMEEAQKKKNEMSFTFRVTLPNAVATANGTRADKTVIWAVERAKCKDDDEFATRLGGVFEATCGAEGLKFSPVTPPRLGLLPFSELVPGKVAAAGALPDTNRILSAARFVPYVLHVTRSLDLSGEGSGRNSEAQLTGAIFLPAELAPQQWGPAKLEEAVDAKGNSLMPKQEEEGGMPGFSRYSRFSSDMSSDSEEADEDGETPHKEPGPKPHLVTLAFKAPEWKVKQIARIKGAQELLYLGASEVVKLSNAVPAALVMDMSKRSSFSYSSLGSERGEVNDPRLAELGLALKVQMAIVQSGMTVLSLQTTGGKATLVDAQVFDVEGKPWPTTLMRNDSSGGEDHSCQVMVAGKPKPPFSLALEVGGYGASVAVPILVENVSVGDK